MTQATCPQCDCTTFKYQENYGYWECNYCGYVWGSDQDDPDYEESENDCPVCLGTGLVLTTLGKDDCSLCGGYGVA